MKLPPLSAEDQQILDDNKMTVDCYGGALYKGVYIAIAYNLELRAYYYIVRNINELGYVWSLREATQAIDKALAKLNQIGEPWD